MKRKGFIKKTFGKKFTIADALLISIILGFPIYKLWTGDFVKLIEDFAGYIWAGVVVGYIGYVIIKRAKK